MWLALATLFLAFGVVPFTRPAKRRSRARQAARDAEAEKAATPGETTGARAAEGARAADNALDSAGELVERSEALAGVRARRAERARRFTRFNFSLSAALATATAGAILAGFDVLLTIEAGIYAAALTLIWMFALRFPRSIGVPALLIFLAAVLFAPLATAPWYRLRENGNVARLRMLNVDEDALRPEWIEIRPGVLPAEPPIPELSGLGVVAEVTVIRIPKWFFVLTADALVRVDALSGANLSEGEWDVTGPAQRYATGDDVAGRIAEALGEGRVPELVPVRRRAFIERPVLLADYNLYVAADATVEFERVP